MNHDASLVAHFGLVIGTNLDPRHKCCAPEVAFCDQCKCGSMYCPYCYCEACKIHFLDDF